jgi:type IX secretion system substrate protein/NHL repeat-containing protein
MKNKLLSARTRLLVVIFLLAGAHTGHAQIITTIAGGGTSGLGDGGPAVDCELKFPYSAAVDAAGNLYIADLQNNRIRKVNTSGIITTIAGTGVEGYGGDDSAATAAKLALPSGVAVDVAGNVYVSDNGNHRIRMVNTAGIITTVAGTGAPGYNADGIAATAAKLYSPHGIAVDGIGNLYICDVLNNRLRKVDGSGTITTIAGTGTPGILAANVPATSASIGQPFGVAVDKSGNIFFADVTDNMVCKINTGGIISIVAGTGTAGYNGDNISATTTKLNQPFDVVVDGIGNVVIADLYNYRIRIVNTSGIISTIAGTGTSGFSGDGGAAMGAEIGGVTGLALDKFDNLYIVENENFRIRYIKNSLSFNTINVPIQNINIYPNPSCSGDFTVDISGDNNEISIIISNVIGEKVKEIAVTDNMPFEVSLDVPNGIYLLTANTRDWKVTKKLVVQR